MWGPDSKPRPSDFPISQHGSWALLLIRPPRLVVFGVSWQLICLECSWGRCDPSRTTSRWSITKDSGRLPLPAPASLKVIATPPGYARLPKPEVETKALTSRSHPSPGGRLVNRRAPGWVEPIDGYEWGCVRSKIYFRVYSEVNYKPTSTLEEVCLTFDGLKVKLLWSICITYA